MKRVLQIITRSDWAGGQKVLYSIVYGLKKYFPKDFEVEVACGPESGILISELRKLNIKVHVINHLVRRIAPTNDVLAYMELRRLISEGKYDVVHTHSSKAGVLGRIAAKKVGVANVIHTYHGFWGIEQYKGLKKRVLLETERIASKYCDYLVFLCEREKEKARHWRVGRESQYVVIPNALIPSPPYPKGSLRKELGISGNIKIIGNAARLDPQKNPIRFLKIAKEVLKRRNDVIFVWIGGSVVENEYGTKVMKFLGQNDCLKDKVFFLPFRRDATELMADFDLFLLTSDEEGMPLVVLEALEQGIPVVSTDVGCVGEMVEFVARDDFDLVDKVLFVLEKEQSSAGLGLRKRYNYHDFILKYAKLYNATPG